MGGLLPTLALGLVGNLLGKKKQPKPPVAAIQPIVQQRPNSTAADALSARRGSRDNQRSGRGGAEVPASGKSKLGQ